MSLPSLLCKDCSIDTIDTDYYMVKDSIWYNAHNYNESLAGMLCIKCLEERLNRKLTIIDFLPCSITDQYLLEHGKLYNEVVVVI